LTNAAAIPESRRSHRFGRFELQPAERRLLEDGLQVAVGARAFDVLVTLVERAGQLVTKNELMPHGWSGLVVEENNLQVQVSALRKLLGQSAVATIPGRGYRFGLSVELHGVIGGSAPSAAAVAPLPVRARTNLPAHLLSLYGRAQDLATIKALLRQHVVVTVVGAGGIGKTRVAQKVAADIAVESSADFPDGVWWVELAALSDGALVPSTVARALGVQLSGDQPPASSVASLLASQRLLLVLDNCEHLIDSVAQFIEAVRAVAPQVRFLATSQETLKMAEEHIYRIGGLTVPVDDRGGRIAGRRNRAFRGARKRSIEFHVDAREYPAVIRIAGTRWHSAGHRLRRRDCVAWRRRTARAHRRALQHSHRGRIVCAGIKRWPTLEWSYGLLTPMSKPCPAVGRLRRQLRAGGRPARRKRQRIDTWAALDHLGALVDKSLVLAEGGGAALPVAGNDAHTRSNGSPRRARRSTCCFGMPRRSLRSSRPTKRTIGAGE
jgi:predicted ATPase/DNA-binding winged helix-turn-helix (wHTH) protein